MVEEERTELAGEVNIFRFMLPLRSRRSAEAWCLMSCRCRFHVSHGQHFLSEDHVRAIWDPYQRSTRLYVRSFHHGSHVQTPGRIHKVEPPNSGFYSSCGVDDRTLRGIYFLDPPRGVGCPCIAPKMSQHCQIGAAAAAAAGVGADAEGCMYHIPSTRMLHTYTYIYPPPLT